MTDNLKIENDNKISVIIPTVQKKLIVLENLLKILARDSSVTEIILINNLVEKDLNYAINKVKTITPNQNLYVNKSWNLGIQMIKNENFVLMNDDCLICKDFCKMIVNSKTFNDETTGLLGADSMAIINHDRLEVDILEIPQNDSNTVPIFTPMDNYMGTGDWGISIFGKKSNYYTIPSDLKIIFGDNYLLYKNLKNNKINYKISGIKFNHIHSSSSSSPEFMQIIGKDFHNHKKYFD